MRARLLLAKALRRICPALFDAHLRL